MKWWLNDRVVDRGTLTIPRFSWAFAICTFGCNVEDPANNHLIGIIRHLVGNMKSAYLHEIVFKSLQNLIIIDFLGRGSGGEMTEWVKWGARCIDWTCVICTFWSKLLMGRRMI